MELRGIVHNWFSSYLTNRKQYVNDMQNAVSDIKIRLFADDTNLFLHDKDYKSLVSAANYNWNKLSEWLSVNKLSLNISKTCYSVFLKTSVTSDCCRILS